MLTNLLERFFDTAILRGRDIVRPRVKFAIVLVGYLLAVLVAFAVVSIYVLATNGSDRNGSSGMYAFGDSLLFLLVLSFAAIPATCAALFFLREYRRFWSVLSIVAITVVTSGFVALWVRFVPPTDSPNSMLHVWAILSPLRFATVIECAISFRLPFGGLIRSMLINLQSVSWHGKKYI